MRKAVIKLAAFSAATIMACAAAGCADKPKTIEMTAAEFVSSIKIGWNLGNTLESYGGETDYIRKNKENVPESWETAWGNPLATEELVRFVKDSGFNAIRIPVSWGEHIGDAPDYKVDEKWMKRVKEVVDYAVDNDLYVILNTHHEELWALLDEEHSEEVNAKISALWTQIAERFKNYDEHLIFEGLNEPRTLKSANEWDGGTPEEREILNSYLKTFVDSVRATGGTNSTRFLMVTPYGANSGVDALDSLVIPNNDSHIIVSVHAYVPWRFINKGGEFTNSSKRQIDDTMEILYNKFVSKGIPVIMGEFGAKKTVEPAARTEWAAYYVKSARSKGIPCFIWDDGGDFTILDRDSLSWTNENMISSMIQSAQ